MAFLTQEQLEQIGFKSLGKGVLLSDKASIYGAARIEIGDHTRIDDFCIISAGEGGIRMGRHVHVACYVLLVGAGAIDLGDFVGVSGRSLVYSSNDDYSGEYLSNPTVPAEFKNVNSAPVTLGRHVLVGAGCILLPGVTLGEGCSVGAMSLVKSDCEPFGVYAGVPARFVKARSRRMLELERILATQEG